jgi:hypothetical protein
MSGALDVQREQISALLHQARVVLQAADCSTSPSTEQVKAAFEVGVVKRQCRLCGAAQCAPVGHRIRAIAPSIVLRAQLVIEALNLLGGQEFVLPALQRWVATTAPTACAPQARLLAGCRVVCPCRVMSRSRAGPSRSSTAGARHQVA